MPPRRHRIVSSSSDEDDDVVSLEPPPPQEMDDAIMDEEEEEDRIISAVNLQNVTLNSSNSNSNPTPRNPNILQPVPFHISDSDSDSDDVIIEVPPNSSNPTHQYHPCSDGAISNTLQTMGLTLRREWLESCLEGLERSVRGFSGLDDSAKAKLCFEQFLHSDMNHCGAGVLPPNVHSLHLVDLKGPFVLQVDEIVNISCPLRGRYQKAAAGIKRCLKLSMTDGVQRVFGMEYRPIKDLEFLSPVGLKVVICNVNIRHGLLMLVPEVIEVLGGKVEELDAAQQRLIHEINKPPRGKRTRTGEVPPLATRATLAAWPRENVNAQEHVNSSRPGTMPFQVDDQGTASDIPTRDEIREPYAAPLHRVHAEANQSSAAEIDEVHTARELEQYATGMSSGEGAVPIRRTETEPNSLPNATMDVEDIHMTDELEHSFLFSVEKESPFTYLASLSAKWVAMKDKVPKVQGKIKCFLTGVKGFRYKQRTMYELRVYIDDGSLISEILIDHNVVQNGIGYSPVEVSTALVASDARKVSDMKETLKQFQIYLVNFEGTMLVQMTEASSVPVAIEMYQGCTAFDAWLLLERVRPSISAQQGQHPHVNAINLSP